MYEDRSQLLHMEKRQNMVEIWNIKEFSKNKLKNKTVPLRAHLKRQNAEVIEASKLSEATPCVRELAPEPWLPLHFCPQAPPAELPCYLVTT